MSTASDIIEEAPVPREHGGGRPSSAEPVALRIMDMLGEEILVVEPQ